MRCSSETLRGAWHGVAAVASAGRLPAGSGAAGRELRSPYGAAAALTGRAPFAALGGTEILWPRFLPAAGGACARGGQAEARSVELSSGTQPESPRFRGRGGLVQAGGDSPP